MKIWKFRAMWIRINLECMYNLNLKGSWTRKQWTQCNEHIENNKCLASRYNIHIYLYAMHTSMVCVLFFFFFKFSSTCRFFSLSLAYTLSLSLSHTFSISLSHCVSYYVILYILQRFSFSHFFWGRRQNGNAIILYSPFRFSTITAAFMFFDCTQYVVYIAMISFYRNVYKYFVTVTKKKKEKRSDMRNSVSCWPEFSFSGCFPIDTSIDIVAVKAIISTTKTYNIWIK